MACHHHSRKTVFPQARRRPRRVVLSLAMLLAVLASPARAENHVRELEFRGQVVLPKGTVPPRKRITVTLISVSSSYIEQKWAGSRGDFRFDELMPGTYSLVIYVPGRGEIRQTIPLTESFADRNGRVEKKFSFDAETLEARARLVPQGIVSVRELSISRRARGEYKKAQDRLKDSEVDRAIEHLENAVSLAPQFAEALNNLGTIYYHRKEFTKAEAYFREALRQEPEAFEPLVNLGGTLLAQRRWSEALEINRRAQEARPNDALVNAQLGHNYFALDEYDQALEYLERTKALDPAHYTHPQILLAEIHLRRFEEEAAVREMEEFLRLYPDAKEAERVRTKLEELRDSSSAGAERTELPPAEPST